MSRFSRPVDPRGGSAKRKGGRPRSIDWQRARALFGRGCDVQTVVLALEVPEDFARLRPTQERLKVEEAAGHARLRAAVAARVEAEGVKKGRSHALLALARKHLGFDDPRVYEDQDRWSRLLAEGAEHLSEILERLAANRSQAATDAAAKDQRHVDDDEDKADDHGPAAELAASAASVTPEPAPRRVELHRTLPAAIEAAPVGGGTPETAPPSVRVLVDDLVLMLPATEAAQRITAGQAEPFPLWTPEELRAVEAALVELCEDRAGAAQEWSETR